MVNCIPQYGAIERIGVIFSTVNAYCRNYLQPALAVLDDITRVMRVIRYDQRIIYGKNI